MAYTIPTVEAALTLPTLRQIVRFVMKHAIQYKRRSVPAHTTKVYGGRIGIAQLILNFDTTCTAVMDIMLRPHYPLGKKRCGHSDLICAFWRGQKNLKSLQEFGPGTVKLTASPTQIIRTPPP
jgi:hypothetical protein